MKMRLELIGWAILGRPIIYGCKFTNDGKACLRLTKDNHCVFIAKNVFSIQKYGGWIYKKEIHG